MSSAICREQPDMDQKPLSIAFMAMAAPLMLQVMLPRKNCFSWLLRGLFAIRHPCKAWRIGHDRWTSLRAIDSHLHHLRPKSARRDRKGSEKARIHAAAKVN